MAKQQLPHYNFILASIRERILFTQFQEKQKDFNITYISSELDFKKFDAVIQSGDSKSVVEIKVRPKTMEYDNWFLQEDKFSSLTALTSTEKALNLKTKAIYVCFFDDGVIYWDINNKYQFEFETLSLPKTSCGDKTLTDKRTTKLMNKNGTVIKYQTNIAQATEDARVIFKYLFPNINID